MKLHSQLLLLSLLALLLPWAGCTYVSEMETALRSGQQQALLRVNRSVVSMLQARPDLLGELGADFSITAADAAVAGSAANASALIYLHELGAPLGIDGYLDDDPALASNLLAYVEPGAAVTGITEPLQLNLAAGAFGDAAYLYLEVVNATLWYRPPAATSVAAATHVELALTDATGGVQRFWVSPEGPGEFAGLTERNGKLVSEYRVRGVWRDTPAGYVVELTVPRAWLHDRLGVAAVEARVPGADERWAGTMPPGAPPGRLLQVKPLLAEQLDLYGQPNLRVSLVNDDQWLLAQSGAVDFRAAAVAARAPGAWLLDALYRWAMRGDDVAAYYPELNDGKLQRPEVAAALTGIDTAAWYASNRNPDMAVVSVAAPLRIDNIIVGAVVSEESSAGIVSLTQPALVRLVTISSVLMLALVGGLLGYASWLSWRVRRLNRAVSAVMEPGGRELRAFPAQTAGDEIGSLGRSFGRLLGQVRGYTDYLQTLAAKLSHELRTPLAVVSSSLDNLEHEALSPQAREYLARATNGTGRLAAILAAMSEAGRIEHSIADAEVEQFELAQLLRDVIAGYRTAYPCCTIESEIPSGPVSVTGNAELAGQMLDKLMDNARDYCPPDGVIRFALQFAEGTAVISVSNDGPLLPAGMEDQLFESMVSNRSRTGDGVHMGLGLTIVRLVAGFHGGTAGIENRAEGNGVVVRVTVPAI